MIYILDQKKGNGSYNASGKAMLDVFTIMGKIGAKTVAGIPKDKSKFIRILDYPILLWYCLVIFSRGDKCIYVYTENVLKIKIVNALRKIRKYETVCLVNDIEASRSCNIYDEANKAVVGRELALICAADTVLAPNEGSVKYLKAYGAKCELIPVKVWDYLLDYDPSVPHDFSGNMKDGKKIWKIAFVGNLAKSVFLKELNRPEVDFDNVEFHLWGGGFNADVFAGYKHVVYEGSVAPDELPKKIASCDIGLVWDGGTVFTLDGIIGNYLQFCNSHKMGCYLASGLPVISCSKSGGAYFVRESGCGICLDSLQQLGAALESIGEDEYMHLLSNVKQVSEKIRNGEYIIEALKKCE